MNPRQLPLDLDRLAASDLPAMVLDRAGCIVAATRELERVLGWEDSIVGVRFDELVQDADDEIDHGNGSFRVLVRRDRLAITVQTWSLPLDVDDATRLVLVVDVTSSQQRLADLSYQAFHDQTSRLPNRNLALDHLQDLIGSGRPVALVVVELQRFDALVALLGEEYAGALIGSAAKRIEQVGHADDLVARISANHLLVARPDIDDAEDVLDVAIAIVDAVGQTVEFGTASFPTGATCGGTLAQPGDDPESVLHDAELATRYAVNTSCEVAWFDVSMRDVEHRQLMLERALQQAVTEGQLQLHLQPVVDIVDGGIRSFEGLARWHHPLFGNVSPAEFIPLAERSGLIRELGDWCLAAALRVLDDWRRRGVRCVPIAINLSATQLLDAAFTSLIVDSVRRHDAIGLLTAEVTESVLLSPGAGARLHELVANGIGVAIDDFGTGFSALSYLAEHPLSTLKIDRSFVTRLAEERNRVLVAGTVDLAHALGLQTIAEGVETDFELGQLRAMGCDAVQGYLTGRPAPASTFDDVLGRSGDAAVT